MSQTLALVLSAYPADHRLDVEVLLAHLLSVNRAYLHAHPEQILTQEQSDKLHAWMREVQKGCPVAYLTGHQEFWSLDLLVSPDTLIPRPETELLVELALQKITHPKSVIADLGTGSGAIGLALASELPDADVYATDVSAKALAIAKKNAARLLIKNITFSAGVWCSALPKMNFDLIVSNPPYIAIDDVHLTNAVRDYEPHLALFSDDMGVAHSRHIISDALRYLKPGGYLLLEHGFAQAACLREIFSEHGYEEIVTHADLAGHDRVTGGRHPL